MKNHHENLWMLGAPRPGEAFVRVMSSEDPHDSVFSTSSHWWNEFVQRFGPLQLGGRVDAALEEYLRKTTEEDQKRQIPRYWGADL